MKRIGISLVTSALLLLSVLVFPSFSSASTWSPINQGVPGMYGLTVADKIISGTGPSILTGFLGTTAGQPNQTLCDAGISSSGACNFGAAGVTMGASQILLPVCTTDTQSDCVASMSLGTSASDMQPSTFTSMTAGPTIPADPAHGLPPGSTIGLWTNPLKNGGGVNTYATYVSLSVSYSDGLYRFSNLNAAIMPYSVTSGMYSAPVNVQTTMPSSGRPLVGTQGMSAGCVWTGSGVCGVLEDFPSGSVASMSVRLTNQVGGWFKGRLQSPSLSVTPFNSSSNVVTVSGQTVSVPALSVMTPAAGVSSTVANFFKTFLGDSTGTSGWVFYADDPRAFQAIDVMRSVANNAASGLVNTWSFGSFGGSGNSCLSDTSKILGIVTTNAMAYNNQAPTFSNGTLTYSVAGMHFMPDGKATVQGTYDMVMADSVARCLYGFSSAPISGSVSVTEDSSGGQNVVTTSVSDIGGWVHLAAYNFQFSNPTITAKLTQAAPVVIAAPSKSTTITCVNVKNKKLIKKITAVKPVCPAGYKKV